MSFLRTIRTIRYLKSTQISGQFRHRLRSRFEQHVRFCAQSIPPFSGCLWPEGIELLPPGIQQNQASHLTKGRFEFLSRAETIDWMPDWGCATLPKLWQYNLHYFEWLWALNYEQARSVTLDWITNHPLRKNQVGWESYPLSLRVMNLCGVFFGKFRPQLEQDTTFLRQLWQSIYRQCQWLSRHLETHLLGNHYFENGTALAFAGSCFAGDAAQQWLQTGLTILRDEIPEQILPDGMHFERSPMYHSRILYLLALLYATGNQALRDLVNKPMGRMAYALKCICHPDGQIALLNDSAIGIYNQPGSLLDYCSRLLQEDLTRIDYGCFSLSQAGYYGWRDAKGNYLICDAGRIGPDYIPGHAHADMLNYELSLAGQRVVVDTGVHDYEVSDLRRYCRSTAAHNTVEINDQDQCECWGAFRVGRRGHPTEVRWEPRNNGFRLEASHTGYCHLPGNPIHTRIFDWDTTRGLQVIDKVQSKSNTKALSRIHLHPDCQISSQQNKLIKTKGHNSVTIQLIGTCGSYTQHTTYHPVFGRTENRYTIVLEGNHADFGYLLCDSNS